MAIKKDTTWSFQVGTGIYAAPVLLACAAPIAALAGASPWDGLLLVLSVALCIRSLVYQLTTRLTVDGRSIYFATGLFERTEYRLDAGEIESILRRATVATPLTGTADVILKVPSRYDVRIRSVGNYDSLCKLLQRNVEAIRRQSTRG